MARYNASPSFLMRRIEEKGRSPRIGLSGCVADRKEAEEFVGNQPILVSIGAACVFETELEGLATIDLSEVRQHVGGPVDKDHACEPWGQKVFPQILRRFDVRGVDYVVVHSRGICSGTDAAAGYAAYGE